MRIIVTTHGGHTAGMRTPPRILDVSRLDPQTAERVRALAAAVSADPPPSASARTVRDAQAYTVQIEAEEGVTEVRASDAAMSSSFARLLELVDELT